MKRALKIGGVILLVVIGIVAVIYVMNQGSSGATPNTVHTHVITPKVTPTPTATPTKAAKLPVIGNSNQDNDNGKYAADLTSQENVISAFMKQYVTYSRSESLVSRSARLAPFLIPASPVYTHIPSVADTDQWNVPNFKADVTVVGQVTTGFDSFAADGEYVYDAVVTYHAVYSVGANQQVLDTNQTWQIVMSANTSDLQILQIVDPKPLG